MISSEYLYGGLDVETAKLQKALFERKKAKAHQTLGNLKEHFNLLDFSQAQSDLQLRVDKIKKAVVFCEEQIDEAKEVELMHIDHIRMNCTTKVDLKVST